MRILPENFLVSIQDSEQVCGMKKLTFNSKSQLPLVHFTWELFSFDSRFWATDCYARQQRITSIRVLVKVGSVELKKTVYLFWLISFHIPLRRLYKPVSKHLKNLNRYNKYSFIIIVICLIGALLMEIVRDYRGTWIFKYGHILSLIIFYSGIFWSILNTINLIKYFKASLNKKLFWIFIASIPWISILIRITLIWIKR